MRRKSLFVIVVMLAALIASVPAAMAQTDCKSLVPASPWGPNDQTGATNRVTPAVTKAAAAEIRDGKVIVMSYPLTDGIPLFGTRFTKTILTATTLAPGSSTRAGATSSSSIRRRTPSTTRATRHRQGGRQLAGVAEDRRGRRRHLGRRGDPR
jgi:hypothetical protein